MMKKTGFTLAEVLITLAIIGVVATLTLPALMTNTAEQQAKTAFKKGINTLTEAAQMNQAIAGFDYASFNETSTDNDETQSLYALLSNRTNVDYQLTGSANDTDNKPKAAAVGASNNFVVFFRDGSALSFTNTNAAVTMDNTTASTTQDDGLVYGLTAMYDTNGAKGPNLLSNCQGNATMKSNASEAKGEASATCSKDKRVIKDQFGVRLRGGYAVPNGAAARWAFDN